jgi:hypothetical protein
MRTTLLVAIILTLTPLLAMSSSMASATLNVGPGGFSSIQAAVNAAQPGDTVLVSTGVYQEAVFISTPGITLAGVDRTSVVLEGGLQRQDGVTVVADGVTVKSMTAQNFAGNGFVFSDVTDFVMTDLHAKDNGEYGLYAIHSQRGDISYSYADGHADSGFYIGETEHCACDVHHNEGWNNMLGYSGTANSYVRIFANDFHDNRGGILPNVLPQEFGVDEETGTLYGTQVHTEIYDNYVHDNNNKNVRESGVFQTVHVPVGEGISIAGGWFNDIHDNQVTNNHLWGVGIFWLTTPPRGNQVHDNVISGARYGIWWDEWGEDHCFNDNVITDVQVVSDPDPLPTCPGLLDGSACPEQAVDLVACRAGDVRAPSATKEAFLVRHSLLDLDPNED